jgi:hypothetical protein
MNADHRSTLQTAYRLTHARRDGEAVGRWVFRLDDANRDINLTLPLHDRSSHYVERLYIELDEVRAAQLRASRAA